MAKNKQPDEAPAVTTGPQWIRLPPHETAVMKLRDLAPADYNPRSISDERLTALKASLLEFGAVQPIVVNRRRGMTVVGGHQRIKAMMALGETDAEVVLVDLSLAKEKALNLTLNSREVSGEFTADANLVFEAVRAELPELAISLRLPEMIANLEPPEEEGGKGDKDEEDDPAGWCKISDLFGTDRIPIEAGAVVKNAIACIQREHSPSQNWMILEALAAEYLAGPGRRGGEEDDSTQH